jgi:DNA-directed RNA polymerase specialized sigma24 family protein
MHLPQDKRTESSIYWSAVSLIICEGLSVGAAAERLGIENGRLRNILRRRRRRLPSKVRGPVQPQDECH